jgi:hypothetical protein
MNIHGSAVYPVLANWKDTLFLGNHYLRCSRVGNLNATKPHATMYISRTQSHKLSSKHPFANAFASSCSRPSEWFSTNYQDSLIVSKFTHHIRKVGGLQHQHLISSQIVLNIKDQQRDCCQYRLLTVRGNQFNGYGFQSGYTTATGTPMPRLLLHNSAVSLYLYEWSDCSTSIR